jgi:hypothetical protein
MQSRHGSPCHVCWKLGLLLAALLLRQPVHSSGYPLLSSLLPLQPVLINTHCLPSPMLCPWVQATYPLLPPAARHVP